jgi:hypothetical protein
VHFCSIEYGWSKQGENPAIPDLSGERHGGHQLAEKTVNGHFNPVCSRFEFQVGHKVIYNIKLYIKSLQIILAF